MVALRRLVIFTTIRIHDRAIRARFSRGMAKLSGAVIRELRLGCAIGCAAAKSRSIGVGVRVGLTVFSARGGAACAPAPPPRPARPAWRARSVPAAHHPPREPACRRGAGTSRGRCSPRVAGRGAP